MPDELTTHLGQVAPRTRFTFLEIMHVIALVLVLLAVGAVFHAVDTNTNQTLINRETGYKNRAVTCDLQLGIGLTVSKSCATPEVMRYRDPNIVKGSSASARTSEQTQLLICQVMLRIADSVPECIPILEKSK